MTVRIFLLRQMSTLARTVLLSVLVTVFPAGEGSLLAAEKEGSPFPHFSAVDMAGNTVDTSQFGGKVLLLDFWSIYCSSCIVEMPHLIEIYEKHRDRGLVILGINLDVFQAKRVPKFMKKNFDFTLPYPNIIDDKRRSIAKSLGVGILPTKVLADPEGIVRLFHVGYKPGDEQELEEEILQYLPGDNPTGGK